MGHISKAGKLAIGAGALLLAGAAHAWPLQVAIEAGKVSGASEDGVAHWLGIPFAQPPLGPLRWRAPQPASPWPGVRPADAYGHDCMQVPFPSDAAPLGTPPAEDCLVLNLWRPAQGNTKLPVLVWIYGGGFVNGGSSPATYSGENLARQGILVVSFNYRLGRFGTFAHPALTAEDPDHGRIGNYGYLDQIAALEWVRRNVAAFGGDPANVTVMGESAGGMSVHMLLTSPLAQGLFQRAIIMSGGDGHPMGGGTLASTEATGLRFAAAHGIAADNPQAMARLRALTAEDITDGLNMMQLAKPGERTFASPFADGAIAVDAAAAYGKGTFAHVPVMIGATSGDMGGPDGMMIGGARTLSRDLSAKGVPVYNYLFSYVAQSLNAPAAAHASDIPFFFDTAGVKYGAQSTPRDRAMAHIISAYVVNFARTGDPNGGDLPRWDRFEPATGAMMNFATTGQAEPHKAAPETPHE